jgi:hypothetical protein
LVSSFLRESDLILSISVSRFFMSASSARRDFVKRSSVRDLWY